MKILPLIAISVIIGAPAYSATIAWDGGAADDQWSSSTNWADDAVPVAGNDYVVDGAFIRPPDANSNTFSGDSMIVRNGGTLHLFRTASGTTTVTTSITNLTLMDSEIRVQSSNATVTNILSQSVALVGNNTLNMNEASNFTMNMQFNGGLSGSGNLNITRDSTGTGRTCRIAGTMSSYSGDISFAGLMNEIMTFEVNSTDGWGSGTLNAGSYGFLNISENFTSVATLNFAGPTSTLNLNASSSIGGLTINGTAVDFRTYSASDLTALGLGGTYTGTGLLTVVPEPRTAILGAFGLMLFFRRRDR